MAGMPSGWVRGEGERGMGISPSHCCCYVSGAKKVRTRTSGTHRTDTGNGPTHPPMGRGNKQLPHFATKEAVN